MGKGLHVVNQDRAYMHIVGNITIRETHSKYLIFSDHSCNMYKIRICCPINCSIIYAEVHNLLAINTSIIQVRVTLMCLQKYSGRFISACISLASLYTAMHVPCIYTAVGATNYVMNLYVYIPMAMHIAASLYTAMHIHTIRR